MTDEPSSDLLGALPRTRPHRRSEKRPARNASPAAEQPSPTPTPSAAARAKPTPRRSKAASGAKDASGARAGSGAKAASGAKTAARAGAAAPAKASGPRARAKAPTRPAATTRSETPRTPAAPRTRKPAPATGVAVVGTAVQAAAEIAEIGLTLSRKAVRNAIGRLPRP